MTASLQIALAEDDLPVRDYFEQTLVSLGHTVCCVASTGAELVAMVNQHQPDIVITDIQMPDMDGFAAAEQIYEVRPVPIIIVSGFDDPELVQRAQEHHVLAYLVKPVKSADLKVAIALASRRFAEFENLRQEAADLKQALQDRKQIERAKGILMKKADLDEQQAFRRLQKLARDNNRKLADVAQMILLTEEAIAPTNNKPKPS